MASTTTDENKIDAGLLAEIDAAIADSAADQGGQAGDDQGEDAGDQLEVQVDDEGDEGEEPGAKQEDEGEDGQVAGLSESLIERAVRAGMTLAEANQYPSEGLLESMVSRIEGQRAGSPGSRDDAGEVDTSQEGEDDSLPPIPDLDPEEYSESLLEWAKSVKGTVEKLREENRSLRKGRSEDWLNAKLEGVKDFVKDDPAKAAAVTKKFNVLKAGYKAAGEDVSADAVFQEAARLVLGEDMAKREAKGQSARKRNGQFVARASSRRAQPKADVEAEVVDALDRKYFS